MKPVHCIIMESLLKWTLLLLILELGSLANGSDVTVESSLQEKNNVSATVFEWCIFRVPSKIRGTGEGYTPELVSIGPFHRSTEKLKPMEVHKLQYLRDFLNRVPGKNRDDVVRILRGLEDEARRCYGESISLTSDEFVEMMLVDGSFIIEFLLRFKGLVPPSKNDLFSSSFMEANIRSDLELLENQLPFFVIDRLFNLTIGPKNKYGSSLVELTTSVFLRGNFSIPTPSNHFKHFVHIFQEFYARVSPTRVKVFTKPSTPYKFIPTATELHETGVKFKKSSHKSMLDITFNKKTGVFSIPPHIISVNYLSIIRNVIAFEQFSDKSPSYVIDYVRLMNCLIKTEDDVKFLRSKGIISYMTGDDEFVAEIFNKLNTGTAITSNNYYYTQLLEDVNAYHKVRWHSWREKLKRDYFNSPWSIIALIAAILLFICTATQTYLTFINRAIKSTGYIRTKGGTTGGLTWATARGRFCKKKKKKLYKGSVFFPKHSPLKDDLSHLPSLFSPSPISLQPASISVSKKKHRDESHL